MSLDQDFGPEIPMVGSDHIYGGRAAAEIIIKTSAGKSFILPEWRLMLLPMTDMPF